MIDPDKMKFVPISLITFFLFAFLLPLQAIAQFTPENSVAYTHENKYIKEYPIPEPVQDRGLKGITTDSQGYPWFYYSTNKTSSVFKFEPSTNKFTQFKVQGSTVVDNAIINLAGGMLAFDKQGTLWFTDARTNSIGSLDSAGNVKLIPIPTDSGGPMGITISPDGKSVWFAEITGDKIAKMDIDSAKISEYSTGQQSGPTLLTFDDKGVLWVTLSYSHSIEQVQPWLIGTSGLGGAGGAVEGQGMYTLTIPKPDTFSPFGIAVVKDKLYVSDHGSSRVIVSNDMSLQNYISYWNSPSEVYPFTLPGEIVVGSISSSNGGNAIYFAEHGGNRIAKIDEDLGKLTEYEIPSGPLATTLFIGAGKEKIWFTEWASNKIGYLDTTVFTPFSLNIKSNELTIGNSNPASLDVTLIHSDNSSSSSAIPNLSVIGMSDSGLKGISYTIGSGSGVGNSNNSIQQQIIFRPTANAQSGTYTLMVRATDEIVAELYPIIVTISVPQSATTGTPVISSSPPGSSGKTTTTTTTSEDVLRWSALSVAIGLSGFIVYNKVRSGKETRKN